MQTALESWNRSWALKSRIAVESCNRTWALKSWITVAITVESLNRSWALKNWIAVESWNRSERWKSDDRGWKFQSQLSVENNDSVVKAETTNRCWKVESRLKVERCNRCRKFPGRFRKVCVKAIIPLSHHTRRWLTSFVMVTIGKNLCSSSLTSGWPLSVSHALGAIVFTQSLATFYSVLYLMHMYLNDVVYHKGALCV